MAARYPTRNRDPVRRFGFDDVDLDASDDSESDENREDNILPPNGGSSDESSSDSDEEDFTGDSHAWTFVHPDSDIAPEILAESMEQAGWRNVNSDSFTAEMYIDQFLPTELFEMLAQWANSRARIDEAESYISGECDFHWKDVDADSIKKFIALTMLTGIVKKTSIKAYWSTEPMLDTPYFRSCMSRDRYIDILHYIRFSNPYDVEKENKATRLSYFMQKMKQLCAKYIPDDVLCIDESLVLFKGRIHFKMFIRTKRSRFGVKIFLLTSSSGYMIDALVYYGSKSHLSCEEPGIENLSKSEIVVVVLLSRSNLLDKGLVVTIDNWYCSLRLAEYLLSRRTGLRGTCRPNRGIPKMLIEKKIAPTSSAFMRKGNVLAIKFVDKKVVYFLSTVDSATTVEKERRKAGCESEKYKKPAAIERYNLDMGGIDLVDQLISYHSCMRKSHAWYKKIGFNFIQRLLVNAFVVFRKEKQKISFQEFTKKAIIHFSGVPSEPTRRRNSSGPRSAPLSMIQHFPEVIPPTQTRENPQLKCKNCARKNIRRDSRYQCPGCNKTALCVLCFSEWHAL